MAIDICFERHGNEITKRGRCTVSGKEFMVIVLAEEWRRWKDGANPKHAFKSLNADELRFLISGQTPLEFSARTPVWGQSERERRNARPATINRNLWIPSTKPHARSSLTEVIRP